MTFAAQKLPEMAPAVGAKGLKAVLNILDKWKCTPEQQWRMLGMKKSTYYRYREDPGQARLSGDQLERLSYILNMHAALRVVFDNPENVYGFMSMQNNNPFFNGASPLEIAATGSFGSLYEVYKRVDALRGAGL
ncbi:DUF2384 domain-containing protein [Pseudomaricurvus alcaniphilus]|uniref:MbcA/ParS/Xre antitoxin family protein n=1 Tax=Pseudomaricurvus alcaniphilus TaxID=1166482 RepID=UPI00140DB215|nr:MbcA/ParS/Xre antitoxin family protein [Pseudomaricurvus alcaniphilus]NHN35912.1 DUF2384 domain-containing protein [Pseudomaricurvus alcaniphilus]